MNRKSNVRRFSPALERFKTLLLMCLLISLVILVAVYVGGMKAYEEATRERDLGENFDRLWSVVGDVESDGLDSSRLLPEFIGYKQSSSPNALAAVADLDSISELYELTKPCILELFGSNSVCTKLDTAQGKHRFAAAKAREEFVYLRYHTPVLYQLIYAYAADTPTVSEGDVAPGADGSIGAYISELIIVPDKDFAAHRFIAYATDSRGAYYEFRPSDHVVSSEFYISKLADTALSVNTFPFSFANDPYFESREPMITDEVECSDILLEAAALESSEMHDALLELFEYNREKLDGYSDTTGHVYIDSHSQLRVGAGEIAFVTTDALSADNSLRGIRIDSLLGYISADTSSLFDKITAVDNLIRKLGEISPELIGGEGKLCLGDVYSDGALLIIEYFLTYNGIRIAGEPYLRAVLTEQTISEITLHAYSASAVDTTVLCPSPRYTVTSLYKTVGLPTDTSIDSVRMLYSDGSAAWTVILSK